MHRDKHELSVCALIEHEVGEALLPAGADNHIGIRQPAGIKLCPQQLLINIPGCNLPLQRLLGQCACCLLYTSDAADD